MKEELGRCVQLLIENGWKKDHDDGEGCEFDSYYKEGCASIDISDKEIVFIGESGDFLHLKLNYYSLVGALIEFRQVSCCYTSTRHLI